MTESASEPVAIQAKRAPNNFAAVRLFGALWVLADHAYILTGSTGHMPRAFGTGVLGIVIFFSIGGYLIADAWLRRPAFGAYIANRAVRIFPGLAFVVLLAVFLLGPLVTTLSVTEYFTHPRTWEYLQNLVLRPRYSLPGVFEDNAYPSSVNGSLWTLLPTFVAYLILPLTLILPGRFRITGVLMFGLVSVVLAVALPLLSEPVVVYGSLVAADARMWVYFACGAAIRVLLRPELLRLDVAFALLVGHVVLVAVAPAISQYSLWLVIPYVLIAFGRQSTPILRRVDRFGDLSYGIFLSAFPIQQLLVAHGGFLATPGNVLANVIVVSFLSAVVAVVSLHLVERPALRLRKRLAWRPRTVAPSPGTDAVPMSYS